MFANIDLFYFSSIIFKKSRFHWKNKPSEKNVGVEEKLDCVDIDNIGKLEWGMWGSLSSHWWWRTY